MCPVKLQRFPLLAPVHKIDTIHTKDFREQRHPLSIPTNHETYILIRPTLGERYYGEKT
jgi:hypothetical protein